MESNIPELQTLEEFEIDYNEGFDFGQDLPKRIYSPVMFKNKHMKEMVEWTGRVFDLWISYVSVIRNFTNLAVKKNKKTYKT